METSHNVLVFTHVQGGLGDIASAAKIITLALEIKSCPRSIYWILDCSDTKFEMAKSMLGDNVCHIKEMRQWHKMQDLDSLKMDFVIFTPCLPRWTLDYLGKKTRLNLSNCKTLMIAEAGTQHDEFDDSENILVLGFKPNADGLLLSSILSKSLTLEDLDDVTLKLEIFNISTNFTNRSFNFGYAHHSFSRVDFLDCVLVHTPQDQNDIVCVFNANGEFFNETVENLATELALPVQVELLASLGVGTLTISSIDAKYQRTLNKNAKRELKIILRPSFSYHDVQILLKTADRLLVTGNNSAFEAWSNTKCQLYLYEDVANAGVTGYFLQQQVDSARKVVGELLANSVAIFGRDRRLNIKCFKSLIQTPELWPSVVKCLQDVSQDQTQKWFSHIRQEQDFSPKLKETLKQVMPNE